MATSGEPEIARIFLTGGTANFPRSLQAIERRARVPVEVFLADREGRGRAQRTWTPHW